MHLSSTLPPQVEIGATRRLDWGTEVVTTDGGYEVRNNRWATPLRVYEISYPPSTRDGTIYQAVLDLYQEAAGGLHSFDFTDWTDDSTVAVRFDSALEISGIAGHIDHIVSMTLREVR